MNVTFLVALPEIQIQGGSHYVVGQHHSWTHQIHQNNHDLSHRPDCVLCSHSHLCSGTHIMSGTYLDPHLTY